jgi:hypothetical protein
VKNIFVYYADSPRHGNLTLAIPEDNSYRDGFIYSTRIVADRLRDKNGKISQLFAVELNLGPLGHIPKQFYSEAGISVNIPFTIRLIAIRDSEDSEDSDWLEKYDKEISDFIIEEWEKVYKNQL